MVMAREPSFFSSSKLNAGMMPTNPAARGIYSMKLVPFARKKRVGDEQFRWRLLWFERPRFLGV
jgi:hypothetical protein